MFSYLMVNSYQNDAILNNILLNTWAVQLWIPQNWPTNRVLNMSKCYWKCGQLMSAYVYSAEHSTKMHTLDIQHTAFSHKTTCQGLNSAYMRMHLCIHILHTTEYHAYLARHQTSEEQPWERSWRCKQRQNQSMSSFSPAWWQKRLISTKQS